MPSDCPDCLILWREYGRAMLEHLEALKAVSEAPPGQVEETRKLLDHASRQRRIAREAMIVHEAKAHGITRTP